MLLYLLKSGACLAAFMALYKLLLENEQMHVLKRFYLLGSVVLSFIIPLITFVNYVEVETITAPFDPINTFAVTELANEAPKEEFDWLPILLTIYIFGLSVFLFRFLKNLSDLIKNIRKNPKLKVRSWVHVLLNDLVVPHTFFNYIFLNKQKFEAKKIPHEVLLHENAHASQKHSVDVLIMELLQIVFWFNPLIYILKNWIKLNHEFLADRAVIQQGISLSHYQQTLLAFVSSTNHQDNQSSLANAINYSSINLTLFGKTLKFNSSFGQVKKRFTVMKKRSSTTSVVLRSCAAIPLIAVLLAGFSEQITMPKPISPVIEMQQGASSAEMQQFNQLAEKYNSVPKKDRVIPLEELAILEGVYRKMSSRQKNESLPFPECNTSNVIAQETVEFIEIYVNKKGRLLINTNVVTLENLSQHLESLDTPNTFEEREQNLRVVINAEKGAPQKVLEKIDTIISDFGAATVNIMEHKAYAQQTTISAKEVKEYNSLAKKYNKMLEKDEGIRILKKDVDRMEYLFNSMSEEQRVDAEPFPELPEPPAPPLPPSPPEKQVQPKQPKTPLPPDEALEMEEDVEVVEEINENLIEEVLLKRNSSDMEYANYQIKKIIERQDPYDVVNGNLYIVTSNEKNIVTPNVYKSKLLHTQIKIQETLPPPPPPYKIPNKKDEYSEELLEVYDNFIQKADEYNKKEEVYRETKEGTITELYKLHIELMSLYNTYHSLAIKEGLMPPQVGKPEKITKPINEGSQAAPLASPMRGKKGSLSPNEEKEIKAEKTKNIGNPTLKMTLFDPPYLGPQTEKANPTAIFEKMLLNGSRIWHKGKIISKDEGLQLLKKHTNVQLVTHETPHDVPSMTLDELE